MVEPARHTQVASVVVRERPDHGHEAATHAWIVAEVARLMGLPDAGTVPGDAGGSYCVPDDTLTADQARRLGLRDEHDLLGGVVPHAFVATKVVTHPLVDAHAAAPRGWNRSLGAQLREATVPGFAAFAFDDACRAHALLAPGGPVRLKLPTGVGGLGQVLLTDGAHLRAVLQDIGAAYLARHGVVLEHHLERPVTFSVGQVRCAGVCIAYCGTQTTAANREGKQAYGGSDLFAVRGTFEDLLGGELSPEQRDAVAKAHVYDRFIAQAYPGFYASRRNYDVIAGFDRDGHRRSGVLEQSWRVGGATPAELAAIEAFARDPALGRVAASTREQYALAVPPPDAQIYYAGDDARVGPLTKYRTVTPSA